MESLKESEGCRNVVTKFSNIVAYGNIENRNRNELYDLTKEIVFFF